MTDLSEVTITRLRGRVNMKLQTTNAIGAGFFGAHGFGIVTAEAFGVGATAMPSPLEDNDWDGWMYHQFFDIHSITATIADGANAMAVVESSDIDSKAQRILHSDDVLMGVTEVLEIGVATASIHADTRMLVKLP